MPTKLRALKSNVYSLFGCKRASIGWLIAKERQFAPRIEKDGVIFSEFDGQSSNVQQGGDKMGFERHAYAPFYSRELQRFLQSPVTLVELGVFRGSGLAIFSEMFPPPSVLIGLDIKPARYHSFKDTLISRGAFRAGAPQVFQFDAYAPDISVLQHALAGRTIDVFIDDGPHTFEAIKIVAKAIRPLLSEKYLYVAEDNPEVAAVLAESLGASEVGAYRGLSFAKA